MGWGLKKVNEKIKTIKQKIYKFNNNKFPKFLILADYKIVFMLSENKNLWIWDYFSVDHADIFTLLLFSIVPFIEFLCIN